MKKQLFLSIVVGVILLAAGATMAQFKDAADLNRAGQSNSLNVKPAASAFSLIDLSRIRWSNSYSMGFFSGNGQSGSAGMLNSTMFYEFSPKLSLAVSVGVLHNTGALWGQGTSDATILPGFRLDYHPSEKFQMSIGFQRYNASQTSFLGNTGHWRYPW